jgi:hypothetical protein
MIFLSPMTILLTQLLLARTGSGTLFLTAGMLRRYASIDFKSSSESRPQTSHRIGGRISRDVPM